MPSILPTHGCATGGTGHERVGVLIWLGATLFIETKKDNPLQEWLSRCHFGTGSEKYPDTETHIRQYKSALAG